MKKCLLVLIFISTGIMASEKSNVKSRLISAVQKGQIVETRKLLDEGYDINGRDSVGNTPLIYATMFGFNDIVTLLLSRGADTQIANKKGEKAENFLKKPADDSKKPNSSDLIKKEAINPEDLSFDEINKIEEDPKKAQKLKEKYKDTFNKIANPGISSIFLQNKIKSTLLTDHEGGLAAVAISQDSKYIVTGSSDQTAIVWDVNNLKTQKKLVIHSDEVGAVAISPDGKYIVEGSYDHTAKVWDVNNLNLKESTILVGHEDSVEAVAISPDGKYIVTGSHDHTARVWDVNNNLKESTILAGHKDRVNAVAISPDSKYIVTGSDDGTARVWDINNLQSLSTPMYHERGVNSVAISQNGKYIVTGSWDGTARVWDINNLEAPITLLEAPIELTPHAGTVFAVAVSSDGKYIVIGYRGNTARVWDINNLKTATELKGHDNCVSAVAISSDDKYIVTGSWDNTARVWDLTTWVVDEFLLKQLLFIIKLYQLNYTGEDMRGNGFKSLYNSFNDGVKKKIKILLFEAMLNNRMISDLSKIVIGYFGEIPELEEINK